MADGVSCRCAFVNFTTRLAAEQAAQAWANGLDVDGERAGVRWGKSKKPAAPAPAACAGNLSGTGAPTWRDGGSKDSWSYVLMRSDLGAAALRGDGCSTTMGR